MDLDDKQVEIPKKKATLILINVCVGQFIVGVKDPVGKDDAGICGLAYLDAIAARLVTLGAPRLALVGGLAPHIESRLSASTQARLVAPLGDALDGALQIAHRAVQSVAA